jgi:hypothetical protein
MQKRLLSVSASTTRNQNFVPTELLLVAVFLLVLLVCCGLTHRVIEAPMQRLGRRVTRRLDVRFGPDTAATQPETSPLRQRNETLIPVRSNALEPRFHGVRHDGLSGLAGFAAGTRGNAICRRSFRVSGLLSGRFQVPFRRAPGTADWRVIPMAARSRARPWRGR